SVQLESEAAQLDSGERAELLKGLGLGEGALSRVVRAAYLLLGRRTFLTTGDKESRAWTFRAGAKAPECAGVIHSDLQRGFIRAEVIRWDELLEPGAWSKAKEAGKLRVEGEDYEVVAGDTLEIRVNVERRPRARCVTAAESGAFERWRLAVRSHVEIKRPSQPRRSERAADTRGIHGYLPPVRQERCRRPAG